MTISKEAAVFNSKKVMIDYLTELVKESPNGIVGDEDDECLFISDKDEYGEYDETLFYRNENGEDLNLYREELVSVAEVFDLFA